MNSRSNTPAQLVFLGVFAMVIAGGLAVMHVGKVSRENTGIRHGFSFRSGGAEEQTADKGGFVSDLKRGVGVVAGKAGDAADGLLSWFGARGSSRGGASAASAPASSGPAGNGGEQGDDGAFDPFADFYSKFYGPDKGQAAAAAGTASGGSWAGSGGTVTAASRKADSSSSGGSGEVKGGGAISLNAAEASRPVFGGPTAKARPNTTRVASVSMNTPLQKSVPPPLGGGPAVSASVQGRSPGGAAALSGGLSGFNNRAGGPGDLNDSASGLRSEALGKYDSNMALGASGVASAASSSGSGAPQASGPERVASSSGGSGGSSGGSAASGGPASGAQAPSGEQPAAKSAPAGDDNFTRRTASRSAEETFLGSVAAERINRDEGKYLQQEDYKAQPDSSLLKSGAMPGESDQKSAEAEGEKDNAGATEAVARGGEGRQWNRDGYRKHDPNRPPPPPPPPRFDQLSDERKLQIRQRIHRFMRRFENRYGMMHEVSFTPCDRESEVCDKHKLTQGFITEITRSDAKLVMGVKYHKQRWRPYVISVVLPDGETWTRPYRGPYDSR